MVRKRSVRVNRVKTNQNNSNDTRRKQLQQQKQQQQLKPNKMTTISTTTTTTTASLSLRNWSNQIINGFTSLKDSPSELYKIYILKFLDSYSYFSFSIIFTLYLSDEFHYNDIQAGTYYGFYGAMITIYGLLTGFIVDNIGVSKSLRLGFIISCISRIFIFTTTSQTILLFNILGLLPIGNCLGIPVLTTAIRRYTLSGNRGFAYGLFYVIMNIAALLSGPIVDIITIKYNNNNNNTSPRALLLSESSEEEWTLTGNRLIVLTGVIANVIAVFVSLTVREIKLVDNNKPTGVTAVSTITTSSNYKDNVGGDNNEDSNNFHNEGLVVEVVDAAIDHQEAELQQQQQQSDNVTAFTPLKGSPQEILKETIQTKRFWVSSENFCFFLTTDTFPRMIECDSLSLCLSLSTSFCIVFF